MLSIYPIWGSDFPCVVLWLILYPIWGSDFFCVLLWLILDISLYFLYNINISGIGWLVGGSFMDETFLAINVTL